ncbi:ROK family protein [Gleimia coleocanis DSM 15436]|uniref:ROK family protein n=1 Tax=Gleimia coleocanis DSM 15436 TaxID=525245 RepID=C0W0N6_9ACTO|nr:ROK family protein [Gleimia coleocanis]EEH64095.1 ROK family protein [Gleimia coleocanis DSM 15436]
MNPNSALPLPSSKDISLPSEDLEETVESRVPPVKQELLHAALQLFQSGLATSRNDLRNQLQISASTASNLSRLLLQKGLISEEGTYASTGGRPASRFKATTYTSIIAVGELGTNHALLGITDEVGNLVITSEIKIAITEGPQSVIKKLCKEWRTLLNKTHLQNEKFAACALALPGPVSSTTQRVTNPARMPNWHNVPITDFLTEELGCPAYIDNDARAAAYGEVGSSERNYQNFIYVKTGSGIGACCVIDGQPYSGGAGVGGDITHTFSYPPTDTPCACGRIGCLETIASGYSIRQILAGQGLVLENMRALVETADQADPRVTSALRIAGQRLGEALAPLVNFLNPEAVVLGGSLSEVGIFKAAVRAALYNACLSMTSEELDVVLSTHRRFSALIGLDKKTRVNFATETSRLLDDFYTK